MSLSTEILSAGKITDYTLVKTEFINALKSELFRDVIKEDISILYWSNQEKVFYIQGAIDKTTIIRIAESIEKK